MQDLHFIYNLVRTYNDGSNQFLSRFEVSSVSQSTENPIKKNSELITFETVTNGLFWIVRANENSSNYWLFPNKDMPTNQFYLDTLSILFKYHGDLNTKLTLRRPARLLAIKDKEEAKLQYDSPGIIEFSEITPEEKQIVDLECRLSDVEYLMEQKLASAVNLDQEKANGLLESRLVKLEKKCLELSTQFFSYQNYLDKISTHNYSLEQQIKGLKRDLDKQEKVSISKKSFIRFPGHFFSSIYRILLSIFRSR